MPLRRALGDQAPGFVQKGLVERARGFSRVETGCWTFRGESEKKIRFIKVH